MDQVQPQRLKQVKKEIRSSIFSIYDKAFQDWTNGDSELKVQDIRASATDKVLNIIHEEVASHQKAKKKRTKHKGDGQKACPICGCDYTYRQPRRYWYSEEFEVKTSSTGSTDGKVISDLVYKPEIERLMGMYIELHESRRISHSMCLSCCLNWLCERLSQKDKFKFVFPSNLVIHECFKHTLQKIERKQNGVIQPCKKEISLAYAIQQFPPFCCDLLDKEMQSSLSNLIRLNKNEDIKLIKLAEAFSMIIEHYKMIDTGYIPCFEEKSCRGFSNKTRYDLSIENFDFISCRLCHVEWCPTCLVTKTDHIMSCLEKKEKDYDPDTLKHIKDLESKNLMIRCPGCMVTIEKNGGCNHVKCEHCHAHICWKCKRKFPKGDDVYAHLGMQNTPCYGIFDNNAQ